MTKNQGIAIKEITPGSIAAELGILPNDRLIAINGQRPIDLIDYKYLETEENLTVTIDKENEVLEVDIEKDFDEDLGMVFDFEAFSPIRSCENHCIFCFVDQLPAKMRRSLYVKDDDYRCSMLSGSFITLTNLSEEEKQRIADMHLSPLHISVHATDPAVRAQMMKNPQAGHILEDLAFFARAGIDMHTQIVLCPGINDGEILEQTIQDLISLGPHLRSIGIVPVGLTGHRDGLAKLTPVNADKAYQLIKQVDGRRQRLVDRQKRPVIYLADEFYAQNRLPVPDKEYYGDFPQLENGIGLVRLLLDEIKKQSKKIFRLKKERHITLVTGRGAAFYLAEVVKELQKIDGLTLSLEVVDNRLFGDRITVSGLLCGKDITEALAFKDLGEALILPSSMFKDGKDVFLDNMTMEEVKACLGVPVYICDELGTDLVDTIDAIGSLEDDVK